MQAAIKDLCEKAKLYFNSLSLGRQGIMQEMKIAVAKETLEAYGIKNQNDLLMVDETYIQNESELKNLTETVSSERRKMSEFAKLSEVYEQIGCGGYINYLVKVEKERLADKRRYEQKL